MIDFAKGSAFVEQVPHECGHDPLVLLMQTVSGHVHVHDVVRMNFHCGHGYDRVRSLLIKHASNKKARDSIMATY